MYIYIVAVTVRHLGNRNLEINKNTKAMANIFILNNVSRLTLPHLQVEEIYRHKEKNIYK